MMEIAILLGACVGYLIFMLGQLAYMKYESIRYRNKRREMYKESYPDKKDWYWLPENQ